MNRKKEKILIFQSRNQNVCYIFFTNFNKWNIIQHQGGVEASVTQSEVRTDLDDRMSCRSRLDGSSAALRLVMRPVVGPGLDLQLQLTLVKLAGQRPVERRWRRSPGGRDSKHSVIRSYASAATNIHLLLFGLKYVRKMWEMLIRRIFFSPSKMNHTD